MTDWLFYPDAQAAMRVRGVGSAAVRTWLWLVVGLIAALVMIGGATRLTQSGLSITEWKPVTGIVPPLSHEGWLAEFERYKQIPQYRELFPDMDLARFQVIYGWEWAHRAVARVLGLAVVLPLAGFWLAGRLSRRLAANLLGLAVLVGVQGAVGWWMVSSGLTKRLDVAQELLALHLLLASLTLAWATWLATGETRMTRIAAPPSMRALATVPVLLVLLQIGLGGLVAGLHAGLTYNTWPLMDGRLMPPVENLMRLSPWWANLVDNVTTVQFAHRVSAYLVVLVVVAYAVAAARAGPRAGSRGLVLLTLVLAQVGVGIATLVWAVPLHLALCHQLLAMVLLVATVWNRRLLVV